MRVLVAPQEFKGTLTATEAATAIAAGLWDTDRTADLDILPLSDGGPGFVDALQTAIGGTVVAVNAHDAIGRPRKARFLRAPDGAAYVEAAQANALAHLLPGGLAPLAATTFGVGEILRDVFGQGPSRVVVGVGGSATTDGGAGMAQALGARLLDAAGGEVGPGGASLGTLDRIEWEPPPALDVVVATDVTNPLLGPNGAAAVFGPQKGANAANVELLERALTRFADIMARDLGVDVHAISGGGAAGGLAAGLIVFLGAHVASGFDVVAEAAGFAERLAAADVVVTGEGSFDAQSQQGKTTGRVIAAAEALGKPWFVFAGRATGGGAGVHTLDSVARPGEEPMTGAVALLRRLAATVTLAV